MGDQNTSPLKWSAQYCLAKGPNQRLQGDKIILPPSALEQLLSASTVAVPTNGSPPAEYGYQAFGVPITDRQQNLPHPLIFRLVSPDTGIVAYAGVREFSANDGEIEISPFLRDALGLPKSGNDDAEISGPPAITVHAQALRKGKSVRFRPLEAGYNPEDWKALLEKHMRNTFTTLTSGEILTIPSGKEQYKFLVDKILPEDDAICIVDTDLEVDIEPLNEEQARETLKSIQEKSQRGEGSSLGGTLAVNQSSQGRVMAGDQVDYTIKEWDRAKSVRIELQTEDPASVDVFISPISPRQRSLPRLDQHLFEDVDDRPSKRVCIRPTNVELEDAVTLAVSVSVYSPSGIQSNAEYGYTLTFHNDDNEASTNGFLEHDIQDTEGDVRCKNCNQWVPGGRMFLHENFCLRNNTRCPKCQQVFQKSSSEWKDHWHCDHDDAFGSGNFSRKKHNLLFHTPAACKGCGEEMPNTMALARHRITSCPEKEILCRFCHLLVPQKGPEDLELTDPEVMLSGLTPHELTDGGRTTECHLCSKIVRLRDMATHMKGHDLDRLSRPTPQVCRNANCGRTLNGVGRRGQIKPVPHSRNELDLCDGCFGPLYNSAYDPEHKALKRRVERRYLTQLVTGCGQAACRNEFCKNGRFQLGLAEPGKAMSSKDALLMTRPELERLLKMNEPLHFCTDEASQKRRSLADLVAAEYGEDAKGLGYSLPWCVAGFEAEGGDLAKARQWLENFAPKRAEER